MKTSLHFISMFTGDKLIFCHFLKCVLPARGRGLSLHLPSWRRDRGISGVPSEAETKEMWRAYQVFSVWYPVSRTARAGGGLIPCHNICQTLALTMARRRVVTGDNGGCAFYIFVLLDISNTCSVAEKWRIMIFAQRWADWAELRGDEFLARKQG